MGPDPKTFREEGGPLESRVLVVDDERNIREFLSIVLTQKAGFEVELAETGEEALQKIEGKRFDLVLTDWKMPRMDGLQLVIELAHSKPEVPTVVMTGYGSIDSAVEAMKHGASDYVTKPFDVDEMIERLRNVLREKGRSFRLRELAQQLSALEEMKSEFVCFASHELKTPLAVIKSAVQLILEGGTGVSVRRESQRERPQLLASTV